MKSTEGPGDDDVERQFKRDYARMTSPVFTWLAWLLSLSVPHKKDFGKFRAGGHRSLLSEIAKPMYKPTPEECEKYWDAKMLSEYGIDACTMYGPDDYWWWQQLKELQEQAAERKRFDKRLNYICIAWGAFTAAGICFAVVVTNMYAK
jgi:hypothetical protein